MVGILDLDPIVHIVANVQYAKGNRDDEQGVRNHVRSFLLQVQASSKCTEFLMFYQGKGFDNFRNVILPEYKSHRTPSDGILMWKPAIMEELKELGCIPLKYIESDDAMALCATRYDLDEFLLVTGDKDADQVQGMHYNPFKGGWNQEQRWNHVTEDDANLFLYCQLIAGDPTDIPGEFAGIPGMGMKKALKYLNNYRPEDYKKAVSKLYLSKFPKEEAINKFTTTYRMVKMLSPDEVSKFGADVESECNKVLTLKPTKYANQSEDLFNDLFDS